MNSVLPKIIRAGYPEKEFQFSGEWEEVSSERTNIARRNRKREQLPVYRSIDGEQFLASWIRQNSKGEIRFLNRSRNGSGIRQCDCGYTPAIVPPSLSGAEWWMCINCKKNR